MTARSSHLHAVCLPSSTCRGTAPPLGGKVFDTLKQMVERGRKAYAAFEVSAHHHHEPADRPDEKASPHLDPFVQKWRGRRQGGLHQPEARILVVGVMKIICEPAQSPWQGAPLAALVVTIQIRECCGGIRATPNRRKFHPCSSRAWQINMITTITGASPSPGTGWPVSRASHMSLSARWLWHCSVPGWAEHAPYSGPLVHTA